MKFSYLIPLLFLITLSCNKKDDDLTVLAQVEKERLFLEDMKILIPSWDDLSKTSQDQIIDKWISETLLKQSAEYHLLDKDPLFDLQIKQYSRQVLADWALSKHLKEMATISDKEINDYYKNNEDTFKRNEAELNGLHVIVKKRSDAYKISRALKRHDQETIDLMLDTLDYEYDIFKLSNLSPSLRQVVEQNHKPGVFGPHRDSGIYHVLELKAWYPKDSLVPLESVWDEIAARLAINKEQSIKEALLDSLRNESKVVVTASSINK